MIFSSLNKLNQTMKKFNILFVAIAIFAFACTPKVADKTAKDASDMAKEKPMDTSVSTGNTAADVINKYVRAIGGKDAIMAISSVSTAMEANTGMGAIEMKQFTKDGKYAMQVMAQGMTVQEIKYDGTKAMMGGMQGTEEITDEKALAGFASQAQVCGEMDYLKNRIYPYL